MRNLLGVLFVALAACSAFTDGATRLAYAIEAAAEDLGRTDGDRLMVRITPAQGDQCRGPYKVQLDKVGALIVWCMDAAGKVVSSHSTSYHARFIDTSQTWLVNKEVGAFLKVELLRESGRARLVAVE